MKPLITKEAFPAQRRIIALLLACALGLTATVLLFPGSLAAALGWSDNRLGESGALGHSMVTIGVSTAEDLYNISKRVNSGESFSDKVIELNADIQLQELQEWVPIGTSGHPFTGVFDGKEKTVRGIIHGDMVFSTLFGPVEKATLKDTTLAVRCETTLSEVDSYLYTSAVTSTIENCRVELDYYYPVRARALSNGPDISWYTKDKSALTYTLHTPWELLGLATIVNNEVAADRFDFAGRTILISGDISLKDIDWEPIGTAQHPFRGTFKGAGSGSAIQKMTINNTALTSAGLFGHIDKATIENIHVTDALVTGTDNVGILVGNATDSSIKDCFTTGSVSGIQSVGGLAGVVTDAVSSPNPTVRVQWSYSTAEVTGTIGVGGLIGQLDGFAVAENCFATGNVSGVIHIGGLAGEVFGLHAQIRQTASTGRVDGSGNVGGLIGAGDGNTRATESHALDSYTASRVQSLSDSGGILGGPGWIKSSYTSGKIFGISELISSGEPGNNVSPGIGTGGTIDASAPSYCNSNTRAQVPYDTTFDGMPTFFFPSSGPAITNGTAISSAFDRSDLAGDKDYEGKHATNDKRVPSSGYYPQLNAFSGSSRATFRSFSKISTSVALTRIPDEAGFNNGYLADCSVDIELDSLSGDIKWRFANTDDPTTFTVSDPTVPEGENTVELVGGKLKIAYKAAQTFSILLEGEATKVPGLVIKKVITIKDEAVRPLLSTRDKSLYPDTTGDGTADDEGFPNGDRLTRWQTSLYFDFPEALGNPASIPTAQGLVRYDDDWGSGAALGTVKYSVVGDTTIKADWAPNNDFVGYDRRLKLSIPTSLGIQDEAGNEVDLEYYFMSVRNLVAKLSFAIMPGQTAMSADADEQTIRMLYGDPAYNPAGGYLEGILSDNESAIAITDADATFAVVKTTFGTESFPAQPGDTAVNKTNFYKYPGVYTFTYQVADPEVPSVPSNQIVRTYDVTDEIKDWFSVNGVFGETYLDEYRPVLIIDGQTTGSVLLRSTADTAKANLIEEMRRRLAVLHKATVTDQASGGEVLLPISYNFSNLPDTIFENGFNGYVYYGIDGGTEDYPLYIQAESVLNGVEIVTKQDYYISSAKGYRPENALGYFEPRLRRINSSLQTYIPADWSLEGAVNTSLLNEGQPLTIRADNIYGINGFSLTKKVVVMIVEEDKVPAFMRDRNEKVDTYFWERIEVQIKQSEPETVVEARVTLKYAYAPLSVFNALSQKDDVTLRLILENGLTVEIHSADVDVSGVKHDENVFNVFVENIQELDVNRDARGKPVQQFYANALYYLPANYTLHIPLNDDMKEKIKTEKELTLYLFNMETGMYEALRAIDVDNIRDGVLTIDMKTINGEYVLY